MLSSSETLSSTKSSLTFHQSWRTGLKTNLFKQGHMLLHCESKKKLGHFFTAYNFRNIEQIFTKLGTNHVLFMLNIMP